MHFLEQPPLGNVQEISSLISCIKLCLAVFLVREQMLTERQSIKLSDAE